MTDELMLRILEGIAQAFERDPDYLWTGDQIANVMRSTAVGVVAREKETS